MDVSGLDIKSSNASENILGRKSWVVYLGLTFKFFLQLVLLFLVYHFARPVSESEVYIKLLSGTPELRGHIESYGPVFLYSLVSVLFFRFIYQVWVLRSFQVFASATGVWLKYGIFPWNKRAEGVRWEHMDMVSIQPTFISWLTNSYTMSVSHSFTNQPDFMVTNIWAAKRVAQQVELARQHARLASSTASN